LLLLVLLLLPMLLSSQSQVLQSSMQAPKPLHHLQLLSAGVRHWCSYLAAPCWPHLQRCWQLSSCPPQFLLQQQHQAPGSWIQQQRQQLLLL
jgi:hypothetical protein